MLDKHTSGEAGSKGGDCAAEWVLEKRRGGRIFPAMGGASHRRLQCGIAAYFSGWERITNLWVQGYSDPTASLRSAV